MAQAMVCDGCNAEPAVILITSVPTGDIEAYGPSCIPQILRIIADVMDPDKVPDAATGQLTELPAEQHADDPEQRGFSDETIDRVLTNGPVETPDVQPVETPAPESVDA